MFNMLQSLFDPAGLMPHGMCYLWRPGVLWLNVGSDLLIGLAYYTIPAILFFFIQRRRDMPFLPVFLLFAAFIFLCGTTHFLSAWTVWWPDYPLAGAVKLVTGVVSAFTVLALFTYVPQALTLRTPAQLEQQVAARTGELTKANLRLAQTLAENDRTTAALRASEAQFRALAENAPDIIARFDRQFRHLYVNPAVERATGRSREVFLRRSSRDLGMPEELCKLWDSQLDVVFKTGRGTECEFDLNGPGGRRYYHARLVPESGASGTVESVLAIATDTTERRRAEQRLVLENELAQLLVRQASLHTAASELLRVLIHWLPAAVAELWLPGASGDTLERVGFETGPALAADRGQAQVLFGRRTFRPGEGLIGGVWQNGQPRQTADLQAEPEFARKAEAATLGLKTAVAFPIMLADQSLGAVSLFSQSPEPVDEGLLVTLCAIGRDLGAFVQRKRDEQALREARTAADAANRAKSEFLANMSHEIRTPMSAILGYADVLAGHLTDPDDLQCVKIIQRNGQHLLDVINDILDLTKIEAGRLEIECQRFAPGALVAEVRALMAMHALEKGLTLEVEFEGPLPETVESDPRRLRQILINLVGNAIKFTKQGRITLRTSLIDDPHTPKLRFEVIDTGIGISPGQQAKLFQPFSQADTSATREHGGSGLGLAISRRLAELLGGEITVQSRRGQGSTFSVTVASGTLEGVPRVTPRLDSFSVAATETELPWRLTGRVLVVDDRHDIRYLAQRYLQEAGAEVETAENGTVAVAAVEQADAGGRPFAAIVLDIQMPVMDGLTAARRLRAQGYKGLILALTAHAMKGDREKCLQAGCNDYLTKPIERRQLVATLARHLSQTDPGQGGGSRPPQGRSLPCRILAVDDNEDAANALAEMLRLLGHRVTTAHDGRSALALARSEHPDVLILDLHLPDIGGDEVARALKGEPGLRQSVFIALTGQDNAGKEAAEAGFDYHVLKPASIHDLVKLFPSPSSKD